MNGLRSLGLTLLLTLPASADDWPQWLGPNRDGVSTETVAAWKDTPKPLWSIPVGEGHGGPTIAEGRVFLHTRPHGRDVEEVAAFDARTGNQLWKFAYDRGPFETPFGDGPRSTPTVVDGRVYTLGSTGILTCLDAVSGEKVWQVDTFKEFDAKNIKFGISASPLVHDGNVLINVGAEGASIVAFDAKTGKTVWKTGDDAASYSSPVVWKDDQVAQIVFLTGANLMGLSSSGKVFWKHPFKDLLNESSTTPVRLGDLLVGSSVTAGSVCLKMKSGDSPSVEEVWKNPRLNCYFGTPVPIGDSHLYMVTGKLLPPQFATLHCVDAKTGESVWSKERVGKYHASLLRLADGKVLMLEEGGDLVLLDGSTEKYGELARAKVCGTTWAHPALANGQLFVRDAKELKCVPLSEGGE